MIDQYEERNANVRARHPRLFKVDTYIFEASEELVICMTFNFINGLKNKKWTRIDNRWLVKLM